MRDEVRALIEATWMLPTGGLDTKSLVTPLKRVDEAWRKKHARWLRETNAFGVYFSAVWRAKDNKKPVERQRLADLIGLARAKELEDELVEFMESLPRRYTFEFPIQTSVPFGAPEIKLNKILALVEVQRPVPAASGLFGGPLMGALSAFAPASPQTATITALRVHAVGYFDDSYEDSAAQSALSILRQFTSLGFAHGMINDDWRSDVSVHSNEAQVLDLDDASAKAKSFTLPESSARLLKRRKLSEGVFGNNAKGVTNLVAKALLQQPLPEPERAAAAKENLGVVVRVLGAPQRDAKHLRTGAEWLFDSQAEPNETTALLFAAIGLEAVLEAPANEVTARLGDRVAYLLGRNQTDRKRISESYRKFYQVRSGLVHGRERTLDADGRYQILWAQEVLRSVLAKDLELWPMPAPKKKVTSTKADK